MATENKISSTWFIWPYCIYPAKWAWKGVVVFQFILTCLGYFCQTICCFPRTVCLEFPLIVLISGHCDKILRPGKMHHNWVANPTVYRPTYLGVQISVAKTVFRVQCFFQSTDEPDTPFVNREAPFGILIITVDKYGRQKCFVVYNMKIPLKVSKCNSYFKVISHTYSCWVQRLSALYLIM